MYTLKGNGDITNILETVLKNRDVTNTERFLNPDKSHELSFTLLDNMALAVKMFKEHIEKASKILIVTDRDADGFTSSAILHSYIETYFPNVIIINIHHPRRENGLTDYMMAEIEKIKPNLVILPDSSSNDKSQHESLNSMGIQVIVLDHHRVTEEITESKDTVVVNPQLSEKYTNKDIAGVGVTYRFLQALDEEFGLDGADDNIDLVAIGNVTDGMDMRSEDVRSIVYRGLSEIKNEFLRELIYRTKHYDRELTIQALSWDVMPKLNALIRVGEPDQLQFVYEALLGRTGTFENTRARTEKNRIETWAKKASRLCVNATAKQKRIKNKAVEAVQEVIEQNNMSDDKMLIIPMEKMTKDSDGLLGYIAGDLTRIYQKPVALMLYNKKSDSYYGSIRGVDSVLENTGGFLMESGLCLYVAGHSQAAGIGVKKENIEPLREYIEENLISDVKTEVDFVINFNDINNQLFKELEELEQYWGKGVEPPLFAVTDVELPMNTFNHGANVSKVHNKGCAITAFSVPDDIVQYVDTQKEVIVDVVTTLGINRFQSNVDNQLLVSNFKVKEVRESAPFKYDSFFF